jgi:hypothetical protein
MELLAPAAQQGAIGGVLHQGMLKGVCRIGGVPRRKINSALTSCPNQRVSEGLRRVGMPEE